jgi:Protein of unknown function (DUF3761)
VRPPCLARARVVSFSRHRTQGGERPAIRPIEESGRGCDSWQVLRRTRRVVNASLVLAAGFTLASSSAQAHGSRAHATKRAPITSAAQPAAEWLSTRSQAQDDLRSRFQNIARVWCAPDRSSATQVYGNYRYWERFWCSGRTYDPAAFRLLFRNTGQCGECWTIAHVRGVSVERLRHRATATTSSTSASCPSDYYRNSSGHCVHRPSDDPTGATALCNDGTYSYSEHASGTCSHHGGVARWIHHP